MKLVVVNDDYFPTLSHIEINKLCEDWSKTAQNGQYKAMGHRLMGMGYIALADGSKRDAGDYFCLAQVMMEKSNG